MARSLLPSRRTLLTAGVLAAGGGALGVALNRTANRLEATVTTGTFTSAVIGAPASWVVVYPRQVRPVQPVLPEGGRVQVAVLLHGAGDDAGVVTRLGLDVALARVVRDGVEPFVLAAVSGPGTWWPSAAGVDPARLLTEEFLPLLAENYLAAGPVHRIGLLGFGTGADGALRVGSLLGAQRVAAVAACGATGEVQVAPDALAGIAVRQVGGTGDDAWRDAGAELLGFVGGTLQQSRGR